MVKNKHEQEIKRTIRKTYSKIALQHDNNTGSSHPSSCCAPGCCSGGTGGEINSSSPTQTSVVVGYDKSELSLCRRHQFLELAAAHQSSLQICSQAKRLLT